MKPMARDGGLSAYDLSRLIILVLEKQAPLKAMMEEIFEEFGVPNLHATTEPEAAYEISRQINPDLVIADWSPSPAFVGFIDKLRTDQTSPNQFVPIIVTSTFTDTRHVLDARDQGITEFLAKPVTPTLLYARICTVIEQSRPFIRTRSYFGPDRRRRRIDHDGPDRRLG